MNNDKAKTEAEKTEEQLDKLKEKPLNCRIKKEIDKKQAYINKPFNK